MWQVKIEFLRVQTFLFAIPRLMDILGANTLLGETLRIELYELTKSKASLPQDCTVSDDLPGASQDDPLKDRKGISDNDLDNPLHLYGEGILARDGGHFSALFANGRDAENFKENASALIQQKLPNLRFSVSAEEIALPQKEDKEVKERSQETVTPSKTTHLLGLPALQICEESGRGIASQVWTYTDTEADGTKTKDSRRISKAAFSRKDRGMAFRDAKAKYPPRDIASLMTRGFGGQAPQTFDKLCDGNYLALIHADGNGIGAWSKRVRDSVPKGGDLQSFINHEAAGERFYHAMRIAVRKAVQSAIMSVFHTNPNPNPESEQSQAVSKTAPYRLLMLGGDDLLLACRAEYALEFVRAYAQDLDSLRNLSDCTENGHEAKKPLTVGVGVAIAKPSFPFHRLHQIAEELASSAKRLVRSPDAVHGSVVDWAVCTESWMDDVEAARASSVIRYGTETLALSGKPYFILDSAFNGQEDKPPTLESLLKDANTLKNMPRSQRRALVGELRQGRQHAELCVRELKHSSPAAWDALNTARLVKEDNSSALLWRKADGNPGHYVTSYADLVEITELPNLKLGDERVGDRDVGHPEPESMP